MRTQLYIIGLVLSTSFSHAQTKATKDDSPNCRNNVSTEIGGTAGFYNVGYERQTYKKDKISLYSGIELSYRKIHPRITDVDMVVGLNLIGVTYGIKHQLDVNLSMAWGIDWSPYPNSIRQQLDNKRDGRFYELTFDAKNAIGL